MGTVLLNCILGHGDGPAELHSLVSSMPFERDSQTQSRNTIPSAPFIARQTPLRWTHTVRIGNIGVEMSFEFEAVLSRPISATAVEAVFVRAESSDLRRSGPTREGGGSFVFANRPPSRWLEDIAVVIDERRVYVAFHGASRAERDAFLSRLTQALLEQGVPVRFGEL